MPTFRIHYADGTKITVDAETPAEARKIAERRRIGIITKLKLAGDPQFPPTALAFATCFMFAWTFVLLGWGLPS